jgi:tetratricopeptide (TPR) repeat protein
MGVRTFYDEERVRAVLGPEGALYARMTRPLPEVAAFFELEGEELSLLSDLCGDLEVASAIEQSSADSLEAWQLLCSLAQAGMIDLSGAPISPVGSSGVRSTRALTGSYTSRGGVREERVGSGSQARMPVVRQERAAPASEPQPVVARDQQARPGSQARMPAAREERAAPRSQPQTPAAQERQTRPGPQARMPAAARGEGATPSSQPRMPAARSEQTRAFGSVAGQSTRYSSATMPGVRDEQISQPALSSSQRLPAATGAPAKNAAASPAPRASQREAPTQQPEAAPPPRQRRRPRKLSTALKLLDRELKQLRPVTPVEVAPPAATPAKAHIEQLRRMREAARSQQKPQPAEPIAPPTGADFFRAAQEAMREQKFAKACEGMRKACEAEPNNEVYAMYCSWTEFRSNALRDDGVNKLRLLLREKISDDDHKAFAYYALGHIALFEKKDDAAEKFFRKAVELDKHNKDAQRHLRVIELRKKTAEQDRGNKIFGIEIKSKKS